MKEDNIGFIDDELSREIAVREGINIYIVPEISKIGENYVLSGKILDAKTGNVYVSEVLYAKNRDEVLSKLDKLSRKIRHDLGESRYEIFEDGKPLSRVTTSSLEALKQYTLGVEKHLNLEFDDAATYYEQAILLDSGFTAAMASLGNILYERFDKEEGKEWLDKALVSIDNLTDKEKYSILAFYAANIDHDLNKAVEYTSLLGDLDPGNAVPHNNLGWYYQNLGIYDKCIEEYKTAINIDPDLILAYGGLIWNYLENFGRIDSALVWSEKMRARVPDNPWPYFYMGSAYVGLDSLVKAEEEFLKAKSINTGLTINNYRLALTYGLQGLYEESNEVLNEILRSDPNEVTAHFNLGLNYKMMGNRQDAGKQFLEGKKAAEIWVRQFPDDPVSYTSYGIALTCLGDRETGWEMGKKGIEIDSSSYINHVDLLVVQEKYNDALDYLEKALDHGYRDIVWIKMSPYISLLRDEDRYRELIEKYFD
jgi:tetratricopeptide (TPR) repeat protein